MLGVVVLFVVAVVLRLQNDLNIQIWFDTPTCCPLCSVSWNFLSGHLNFFVIPGAQLFCLHHSTWPLFGGRDPWRFIATLRRGMGSKFGLAAARWRLGWFFHNQRSRGLSGFPSLWSSHCWAVYVIVCSLPGLSTFNFVCLLTSPCEASQFVHKLLGSLNTFCG